MITQFYEQILTLRSVTSRVTDVDGVTPLDAIIALISLQISEIVIFFYKFVEKIYERICATKKNDCQKSS